jgi:hypothetical protein
MVLDSRRDRTLRLCQSMMATGYKKPLRMGRYRRIRRLPLSLRGCGQILTQQTREHIRLLSLLPPCQTHIQKFRAVS